MMVTKEWIMANQTPKGSWNAKQLKCLGINWPAPKGWIGRLVGTEIDEMYRVCFEEHAGEPAKDKINVQDHERRIAELERELGEVNKQLSDIRWRLSPDMNLIK